MTKLIAKLRQLTLRRLAMVAVTLRPSTLTVSESPSFKPSPAAISASSETKGGPL